MADSIPQRLDDWFDGPASLVAEALARRFGIRRLPASLEPDGTVTIRAADGPLRLTGANAATLKARLDGRAVALALPADGLIRRTLRLPVEAAAHLDGIIAARLPALSPLPAADVEAGAVITGPAAADPSGGASAMMEVAVVIAPRSRIRPARALLESAGVTDVVVAAPRADGAGMVALSAAGEAPGVARGGVRRGKAAL